MTEPRAKEWPLVVFTVALQLAAGIALVCAAGKWDAFERPEPLRWLSLAIFAVVAVAITSSSFHLGRPFAGWRALANVRSSRPSAEVIICVVCIIPAAVQSACAAQIRNSMAPV